MARLIDADCFRGVLERYINAPHARVFGKYSEGIQLAIKTCIELLDAQNAVDAVEVVRCKDCKHYSKDGIWCDMNSKDRNEWFNWYGDDFCSYGERRSNG